MQMKDYENAVVHLTRGIDLSPHDGRLAVWIGLLAQCQHLLGDTKTALANAQRAVASDDKTYMARIILAGLKFGTGDATGALGALEECRRLKPDLSQSDIEPVLGRRVAAQLSDVLP